MPRFSAPLVLALVFTVACGDDTSTDGSGGGSGGSGGAGSAGTEATTGTGGEGGATSSSTGDATTGAGGEGGGAAVGCTEPTPVACEDDVVLAMNLQDDIAPGEATSTPDGSGWLSAIDATAGGAFAADPDSYVYLKFADDGLTKVDISDEDSLTSMDWDIAFRRYVVRINSGNSGPSCVAAARVVGATYDEVTSVPDGLTYRTDGYFTDSCEIIPDGTGLPGSPATALSAFWTYPGCVQMTDQAFVIQTAEGRHLKLVVAQYYDDANHASCQESDSVSQGDTGAANYQVRWAFL